MRERTRRVAVGGVVSALIVTVMFLSGVIPFASFAIPFLCGVIIIPIVLEYGYGTALTVYLSTAILSIIVAPDRIAALSFAIFFGYYPIIKVLAEKRVHKRVATALKAVLFAVISAIAYFLQVWLYGLETLIADLPAGVSEQYILPLFLIAGIIIMFFCDSAVSNFIRVYELRFRAYFFKKPRH